MADFVDKMEIDKVRNTAEIVPLIPGQVCFWVTLEIVLD